MAELALAVDDVGSNLVDALEEQCVGVVGADVGGEEAPHEPAECVDKREDGEQEQEDARLERESGYGTTEMVECEARVVQRVAGPLPRVYAQQFTDVMNEAGEK